MTNFDFLLADKQFSSFADVAVAAETLLDGNSVYWMEASEPEEPLPDAFTLPDGTNLLRTP